MQQRYKTRQREAILTLLREHPKRCFSAKELREALLARGEAAGEATVYRTLDLLCRDGALTRFGPDKGKSATYQYTTHSPKCEHHLHFKCRRCQVLYHLECGRLQALSEHLFDKHGFSVNQADTILYGICADCREAAR